MNDFDDNDDDDAIILSEYFVLIECIYYMHSMPMIGRLLSKEILSPQGEKTISCRYIVQFIKWIQLGEILRCQTRREKWPIPRIW